LNRIPKPDDIVLVDIHGQETGHMEKLLAHQKGELHRAFSIFIFNKDNELLLQQRASNKYHSGDLWSNTCCSHPLPGESVISAAHRRLQEEMGFDCVLEETINIIYKAVVGGGLMEYEYDHVLIGSFDDSPFLNMQEAQGWKWTALPSLAEEIARFPDQFTHWLKLIVKFHSSDLTKGLASLRNSEAQLLT